MPIGFGGFSLSSRHRIVNMKSEKVRGRTIDSSSVCLLLCTSFFKLLSLLLINLMVKVAYPQEL